MKVFGSWFIVWGIALCSFAMAAPPSELETFRKWVESGSPADIALARKYLGPAPIRVPPGVRSGMIQMVARSKAIELYPLALQSARTSFPGLPVHDEVVAAIAAALPSNAQLAKTVRDGDPAIGLDGLVDKNSVRIQPTRDSQILAQALFASGSLAGVKTVLYGTRNADQPLSAEALDLTQLPSVARSRATPSDLTRMMQVRELLGPHTFPTREAYTTELLKVLESAPPEVSLRLAQFARDFMVADLQDRYSSQPNKLRTLTLSMTDEADLRLARYLNSVPVTARHKASGEKVTGLRDVEVVVFKGAPEKATEFRDGKRTLKRGWDKVNYPDQNEVLDQSGRRIADLIRPENYVRSLSHDAPKTALWRASELLQQAQYRESGSSTASPGKTPCPFDRLILTTRK